MAIYNVRDFGALANGQNDAPAIQATIDAAAREGGMVYFPAGTYAIAQSLRGHQNVSFQGDNWSSCLHWIGEAGSAMLVLTNEALWGVVVEDLTFTSQAEGVTGILGGSTMKKYNSAIGTFRNLRFSGLHCGISGGAEPEGVGIFDNLFENVFCSRCEYGLHLYGSGNTLIHPRITNCENGLLLDYLNGETFDSMHVFGGVFAANGCDIVLPDKRGIRPTDFVGTWFEDARRGILSIEQPGTRVMNLTFRDCMLNSKAGEGYYLFDARNAEGVVTLDSCTVIDDRGIQRPTSPTAQMHIRNLKTYHHSEEYVISDEAFGTVRETCAAGEKELNVAHGLMAKPGCITVTPGSALAACTRYYVTAEEKNLTIHFAENAAPGEYVFHWHARV